MTNRIAASTTAVVLVPFVASRQALVFFNDSDKFLYLRSDASPTTTTFATRVSPGQEWSPPRSLAAAEWRGLWEGGATGAALATEGY